MIRPRGALRGPWAWWPEVLGIVALLVAIVLTFGHTVDDTFITLRYARNVLDGYGPVFNPGERAVEGFSSPLHLLVLIVIEALPGGLVLLKVKLFSLLCLGVNFVVARRLLAHLPVPPFVRGVALVGVGGSYVLAMAGSNGLSTALTMLLSLSLALAIVDGTAVATPWRAGAIGALVVLVRPEGAWTIAALVAAALLARRRVDGSDVVGLAAPVAEVGLVRRVRWLVGPVTAFVVLVSARLAYYGELLPNPYYAKRALPSQAFRTGLSYAGRSIMPTARWVVDSPATFLYDLAAIAAIGAFAVGVVSCLRSRSVWLVPASIPVSQTVFLLVVGGDWMKGWRFMAVAVVPGIATAALGFVAIGRWLSSRVRWSEPTLQRGAAAALAACLALSWVGSDRVPIWRSGWRFDDRSMLANGGYVGWTTPVDLLGCARPGELVAMTEIGFVPWVRGDLRFLDLSGLNDWVLAREENRAAHQVGVGLFEPNWDDASELQVREIFRRRAEMVIMGSEVGDGSEFVRRYRVVDQADIGPFTMYAWRRRDLPCTD